MPKTKNFTPDFKAAIVARVTPGGELPAYVAQSAGISLSSVRNWVAAANGKPKKAAAPRSAPKMASKGNGNGGSLVALANRELQALKRKTQSLERFIEEQTAASA